MNRAHEPASRARFHTALVTGASSGIGRAFARRLAARGSDLVVVARRRDRLEELARQLEAGCARRVEVLPADLTDPEQLAMVEARLRDGSPPVDLLVNNAGLGTHGPFSSLPVDGEEREIRLNVLAPVRLTHAVLSSMTRRGGGAVVNVSSIAGLQSLPYSATYAATKAYLNAFSLAVHEELRHQGVHVLVVMPGFTQTEFHDRAGIDERVAPARIWMSADRVVDSALRALDRGRPTSVPGLGYRAFALATRFVPWTVSRRVVARARRRGDAAR